MKYFLLFYFILSIWFITTNSFQNEIKSEIPSFVIPDSVAADTTAKLKLIIPASISINPDARLDLQKDYKAIWQHLNHFYKNNDPIIGKEYYTQQWFELISKDFHKPITSPITRQDHNHELHIQSWSDDGLICTAIDSNLILSYHYPTNTGDSLVKDTTHIALILFYQGEHWRIHAMNHLPNN